MVEGVPSKDYFGKDLPLSLGSWETLSLRLPELEPVPQAPSHALLLSSSPSRGARPAPCQRRTVPWRLALIQATGSSLRGRAPSGDAPGGLLGALLLTRDPPLAGELRGCAGSPLQPQVPESSKPSCRGHSLSRVLIGRCLLFPVVPGLAECCPPAPRMDASS